MRTLFPWAILALSFGLFLLAAKAHGRELRLERVAHGFEEVDFRALPPGVQAIWQAERVRFWPAFAVLATVFAVLAWMYAPIGRGFAVPSAIAFAGALAFAICGVLAMFRRAQLEGAHEWPGSIAWWSATLVIAIAIVAIGLSRPADRSHADRGARTTMGRV